MFLILNLIKCTEFVYLYSLVDEGKTNCVLFLHKNIKDDYKACLEINDGTQTVDFREGERLRIISDIDTFIGHSCFDINEYACYETGLVGYTHLNNCRLVLYLLDSTISLVVEVVNLISVSLTIYTEYKIKINYLKKELYFKSEAVKKLLTEVNGVLIKDKNLLIKLHYEIGDIDRLIEYDIRQINYNYLICKNDKRSKEELVSVIEDKIRHYEGQIRNFEKAMGQVTDK